MVTVHQPPVLTAALGRDALMPCRLNFSRKLVIPPVLYWIYLVGDIEHAKVWRPNKNYVDRVDILDSDPFSLNKSIILKNVQWGDGGKYLCKLSVTTETDERFREKGDGTLLMIYGKYKVGEGWGGCYSQGQRDVFYKSNTELSKF